MYALSVHAVSFGDGVDLEVGETVAPTHRIGVARKQECASASHVHAANPDDSDDVPRLSCSRVNPLQSLATKT
jgi:hypothetical protein